MMGLPGPGHESTGWFLDWDRLSAGLLLEVWLDELLVYGATTPQRTRVREHFALAAQPGCLPGPHGSMLLWWGLVSQLDLPEQRDYPESLLCAVSGR